MQIYSVARNVLGALGPKVKVPVLDSELKIPAECLRIVGALASGAIIESGSNANGYYVKLADGTMFCSALLELDGVVVTNDDGTILAWAFPATYIDTNYKLFCAAIGYASNRFYVTLAPQSASYAQGGAISITGNIWTLNASTKLQTISFGRWKA